MDTSPMSHQSGTSTFFLLIYKTILRIPASALIICSVHKPICILKDTGINYFSSGYFELEKHQTELLVEWGKAVQGMAIERIN